MSDELVQRVALLISGVPFPSARSLAKARAIIPLVVEHERERCAAIADAEASHTYDTWAKVASANIATAIRKGNP